MRKFLGVAGFLVMVSGAAGLIYHFTGWFRFFNFVRFIDFLQGYEIVANIVLIAVGFVIATLSEKSGLRNGR